jgi:hypothetical protein
MHVADVLAVCLLVLLLAGLCAVLGRQRYMLRARGSLPVALRRGEHRWTYGTARFVGGELRWYSALGLGTRPTRVLRRGELSILGRRSPEPGELASLPATAVIVECVDGEHSSTLAFSESAYTGFVSWLEAAPRS